MRVLAWDSSASLPLEPIRELVGDLDAIVERRRPRGRVRTSSGSSSGVRGWATPSWPAFRAFGSSPRRAWATTTSTSRRPAVAASGSATCPTTASRRWPRARLALLLALLRGVVALDRSVREGRWDCAAAGPLRRLAGTARGGRLRADRARAFAARALALGFDVWVADPLVPADQVKAAGARPAPLHELLAACEAVSLHAPLMPSTAGLLGKAELALMPPGAVLVNTARAGLVDQEALLAALADGRLAAAALDVLPVEPPTEAHPAPQAPTLVVTPHSAWYSADAEAEVLRRTALAVRAVLQGDTPEGAVVNPT